MCVALPKRTFTLPFAERFHALIEMQAADCAARGRVQRARASAPTRMAHDNSPAPRRLPTNDRRCRSLTASAVFCEGMRRGRGSRRSDGSGRSGRGVLDLPMTALSAMREELRHLFENVFEKGWGWKRTSPNP